MTYDEYMAMTLAFVAEEIEKEIAATERLSHEEITRTN